jgi:hypothetical protein
VKIGALIWEKIFWPLPSLPPLDWQEEEWGPPLCLYTFWSCHVEIIMVRMPCKKLATSSSSSVFLLWVQSQTHFGKLPNIKDAMHLVINGYGKVTMSLHHVSNKQPSLVNHINIYIYAGRRQGVASRAQPLQENCFSSFPLIIYIILAKIIIQLKSCPF